MRVLALLLALTPMASEGAISWQASEYGKPVTYENRNHVDPPVIMLQEVSGNTVDINQVANAP
jgi:hypothetical protein